MSALLVVAIFTAGLGVGGMAAVYAAQHRNGNRVALKVLHDSLQTSPRQRKRLLREAYAEQFRRIPALLAR